MNSKNATVENKCKLHRRTHIWGKIGLFLNHLFAKQ